MSALQVVTRKLDLHQTSVHMLKNIDKTQIFNFVANDFITSVGGGGGGGRQYWLTEGWYRNTSLLPVLCTDSLNSLVEAPSAWKAPPFHQSLHLCRHNLMICSYPRESCAFQTHLQWGWRCFFLLLAPHTVALTKRPTSQPRFCRQAAQQLGKSLLSALLLPYVLTVKGPSSVRCAKVILLSSAMFLSHGCYLAALTLQAEGDFRAQKHLLESFCEFVGCRQRQITVHEGCHQ